MEVAGSRAGPGRRRLPLGQALLLGVALVNLFSVVAVLGFLWQSRDQASRAAAVNAQNLALVLDAALSSSFDKIDGALLTIKEEVERQAAAHRPDDAALDLLLARQKTRAPDALALRIVDRHGVVGRSAPPLAESLDVADRDFFIRLRDGEAVVVSKPIPGRITNGPIVVFARRLDDPSGAFAGAVIGPVSLERVAGMLGVPDVGRRGAVALRTADRIQVAWRGPEGTGGGLLQSNISSELRRRLDAGETAATYLAHSGADGTLRTYSFRRLDHHPFYVFVGLAEEEYLANWRRQAVVSVGALAALILLTCLGALVVRGAWRRQRLAEASLASEEERAERDLVRVQKVESLAVLAGGIAHDFNNLLTGITGNISLAREDVQPQSAAGEALADAEAAAVRARGLTQQLLTFSRGGAPVRRLVQLSAVVEEAASFAARGAGTAVRLELAAELLVEADPGQIGQVVQNLVLNAIQAMGSTGSLLVRTERVEIAAGSPVGLHAGAHALLTVVDQGPGIPPEVLPKIFDPYFTTKATGKGLGLAICHSILRHHAGHVEVASPPGAGATFRVYLPLAAAGPLQAAGPTAAPAPAVRVPGAGRILVMDDEDSVCRLAGRLLRPLGYEVVAAHDGQEALRLHAEAAAAGQPFTAVLMDLTIPGGMGGLETFERLRALDPAVVAIVSSGYSNDPIMAHWAEHGFRGVLTKPYLAGELRETLQRALQG